MKCGYGCDNDAKYPPSKNKTKWSCEKHGHPKGTECSTGYLANKVC